MKNCWNCNLYGKPDCINRQILKDAYTKGHSNQFELLLRTVSCKYHERPKKVNK